VYPRARSPGFCCLVALLTAGFLIPLGGAPVNAGTDVIRQCTVKNMTDRTEPRSNLQRAINEADRYETLTVKGHCVGTFRVDKDLTLVGMHPDGYSTPTLDANRSGTVLRVLGERTYVGVWGVTLTGGSSRRGGAIYNEGEVGIAGRTSIVDNHAHAGGAIFNGSDAELYLGRGGVLIARNTAELGGGIYSYRALVVLRHHAKLVKNHAANGGGIYVWGGEAMIWGHTQITGNRARRHGGGLMSLGQAKISISQHSHVENNSASNGGGVFYHGLKLFLGSKASIRGNSASVDGGGIYNRSKVIVQGSTKISGNTAARGAGLFNRSSGDIALSGASRVSANMASAEGGGIFNNGGVVAVTQQAKVIGNEPDNCVGC
jgi:hypothetical protein